MTPAGIRALVTGGGGGIGGAIADELLGRGASVLLVDRDETALARAAARLARYGDRVGTLAADLTSAADRQRLWQLGHDHRESAAVQANGHACGQIACTFDEHQRIRGQSARTIGEHASVSAL